MRDTRNNRKRLGIRNSGLATKSSGSCCERQLLSVGQQQLQRTWQRQLYDISDDESAVRELSDDEEDDG